MDSVLLVNADGSNRPALARGLSSEGVRVHGTSTGSVSKFSRFFETLDSLGVPDPSPLIEDQRYFGSTSSIYTSIETFREGLIDIAIERDVDVILPYNEENVIVLSSMAEEVASRTGAKLALPDHEDVLDATIKTRTFKRAERNGLSIPNSYYPDSREDVRELFEIESPPIVAKPALARGGGGLVFCETSEEAIEAFDAITDYCEPLFQEYVTGRDYVACTVADRSHTSAGSFVAEEVLLSKGSYGGSNCSITRRQPAVRSELLSIPEAFDWVGPATPEYIVDEETGEAKLMEINPRMFGHTAIAIRSGVNIPYLYDRVARDVPIDPVHEYEQDLMWWDPWAVTTSGQLGELGLDIPRRLLRGKIFQDRYPITDPLYGGAMFLNDLKRLLNSR